MSNFSKKIKGVTFLEVLIVASIIGILAGVIIPQFAQIRDNQVLKSAVSDIVSSLDEARSHAIASLHDKEWGVHFETTKVVIFKTNSYNSGSSQCNYFFGQNPSCNIDVSFTSEAEITDISLSGGGSDVYFNRVTGMPDRSGTITVAVGSLTKTITISSTGPISVTSIPPSYYDLTVTTGAGGTVTSNVGSINCGVVCDDSYVQNTSVSLTATPDSGYVLSSWSGDCSGSGACNVTMTSDKDVTATFSVASVYNLSVSTNAGGTVTSNVGSINCGVVCDDDYVQNTSVILTATPDSGYTFTGWSGACSGTGTCNLNMNSVKVASATFTATVNRNLTVVVSGTYGSSTVTSNSPTSSAINCPGDCSETYTDGVTVTLNANTASGYIFSGWSNGNGTCTGVTSPCTLTMNANMNVTATFALAVTTYNLHVALINPGTVTSDVGAISCSPDCDYSYNSGTAVVLTATPNTGYSFTGWSGDCSGTGVCNLTMTSAKSVIASFAVVSAFPIVESTNTSTSPDGTTSHTVSLPSGIQTGDLILVFFAMDDSGNSVTWPSGWTQLALGDVGSNKLAIGYKVATSPGGTSINIDTGVGNGQPSAHQTIRISGFTGVPAVNTVKSGNSTNPDSNSLNPGWGTQKILWFSVTSRNSGSSRPTSTYPVNYTNGITVHVAPTGTDGATLSTARREREVSSENPGSFSIFGSDSWLGYTVAVQGL